MSSRCTLECKIDQIYVFDQVPNMNQMSCRHMWGSLVFIPHWYPPLFLWPSSCLFHI